ncbi:GTPase, partial [Ottowia sp.]|uniref:GTPase n=1 Tax=Ottowia sp. TaxID=1898956 RepID=UPI003A88B3A8
LAGAELAIVTPIAGTTRDVVQQTIQIEGVPLHVLDTAGLRDSGDEVERIGIDRAWHHIESADAVLLLHDLTRWPEAAYRAEDQRILDQLAQRLPRGVPVLPLWNKCDAAAAWPAPPDQAGGLALSAKTGHGLDTLRQRLLEVAGWQSDAGEGQFIARQRHLQALSAAAEHLHAATAQLGGPTPMLDLLAEELRLAQNALGDITGTFSADDLLGVIFSRFCIGK